MRKVLIANRGEIAVRVARACRDHGLASVAVYADPDRDALHVREADEAYALHGNTAPETYLRIDKLIEIAKQAGADGVHPGYGFLAENADFAEAVIDAGLTWIGPPPDAIRKLGDKTEARHIALAVGAPMAPGTPNPVSGPEEVLAFADEYGLPIAIKAAFGGGGRGLKVARERAEIAELFDSAVREAVAAFGRGECFVERYLDKPRHVETQVLADGAGNVVVVSTRDCSLQRRYQKLVEEAPAPFLTEQQTKSLYDASKAICKEAGYIGAGTCEFLVAQDGLVSFLEVNTRLQVEHPVTEEVTGIDLVRWQFRIADGEKLGLRGPGAAGPRDRVPHQRRGPRPRLPAGARNGHALHPAAGPGVRTDSGIETGGHRRPVRLAAREDHRRRREPHRGMERSRRALDELIVEGMPTALPFHQAVVRDPAFAPTDPTGRVHGAHPLDRDRVRQPDPTLQRRGRRRGGCRRARAGRRRGRRQAAGGRAACRARRRGRGVSRQGEETGPQTLRARAGGSLRRHAGQPDAGHHRQGGRRRRRHVAEGDLVVVLEAMKMEQPLTAHKGGTVSGLAATVGATVTSGAVICEITE